MTERFDDLSEQRYREAKERGEFDNLQGAGKPSRLVDAEYRDGWWLQEYLDREDVDMSQVVHPTLALRKEAATMLDRLRHVGSEQTVREVVADYNDRVRRDRLSVPSTPGMPILARTLSADQVVADWRRLREEDAKARADAALLAAQERAQEETAKRAARRGWWRRFTSPRRP